jgi:hypothetical protein
MNRIAFSLGGGILAAGLSVAVLAHEWHDHAKGDGKSTTVQGELIDAACFVDSDGGSKGHGHAKCAQQCMASGIPAAILPEGSKDARGIMYLLTNPTALAPYAAQTVKVEGVVHADMHAIDVKKLYVQHGNEWTEVQLKDEHHKMAGGADAEHKDHKHE